MSSFFRYGVVAALATACHCALAQTVVPPTVTVTRIAPQLVAFAGSPSNFQNLVNGLTQGTQVQMVTQLPDGFTQIVSFTPTAALPPAQAAQVLETARQQLIGLGIANPTAEQIATTLMGGVVPTALGGAQVPGVLNPQTTPAPAVQAQANAAIGSSAALGSGLGASTAAATTPTSTVTPPVNVQIFPSAQPNTTTTASAPPVNTSDSLTAPGSVSRSPVPATPSAPGPSLVPNPPAPGERPSAIAPAPATPIVTPLPATTPAQPANTSSGFGAIRR
jgi:hypothetical protein